jgi:peptidoglycan hydrolase CwlO-like protein
MRAVMLCTALLSGAMLLVSPASAQNQKEYISSTEADKVREAMDPNERIRLFLSFASDRLKQLQYELDHPANTVRRAEKLNGLLNSYAGCIDEATDRMELSVEKQEDVQEGIKAVQKQAPDFLTHLKDLAAKGPERNTYKENLDDAIASTEDAIHSAAEAMKDKAPAPPVRRPQ